jgi:hypothetical protein
LKKRSRDRSQSTLFEKSLFERFQLVEFETRFSGVLTAERRSDGGRQRVEMRLPVNPPTIQVNPPTIQVNPPTIQVNPPTIQVNPPTIQVNPPTIQR